MFQHTWQGLKRSSPILNPAGSNLRFILVLIVGPLAIRLLLLPLGHPWDRQTWYNLFVDLSQNYSPYDTLRTLSYEARAEHLSYYYEGFTYPPGLIYLYWPLAQIYRWLNLDPVMTYHFGGQGSFVALKAPLIFDLFFKLPLLSVDLGSVWLLWKMGKHRVALRYAWGPLVLLAFAWTWESYMVFCLILGVYLLERGKTRKAALALAFGTVLKILPIFIVPAILLYLLRQKNSIKEPANFALIYLSASIILIIGPVPFVGTSFVEGTFMALDWQNWRQGTNLTWHAVFYLLGFYLPDVVSWFKLVFLSAGIGIFLLPLGLLFTYAYTYRKNLSVRNTVLVTLLGYFAFNKVVNEYHILALIPFLLLELEHNPQPRKQFYYKLLWSIPLAWAILEVPIYQLLIGPLASLDLINYPVASALNQPIYRYMVFIHVGLGVSYLLVCLRAMAVFASAKQRESSFRIIFLKLKHLENLRQLAFFRFGSFWRIKHKDALHLNSKSGSLKARGSRVLPLLGLLVGPVVVRLLVLPLSFHWDIQAWYSFFTDLSTNHSPYATLRNLCGETRAEKIFDCFEYYVYPPGLIYLYWPIAQLYGGLGIDPGLGYHFSRETSIVFTSIPLSFSYFFKIPVLIADIGVVMLLWKMAGSKVARRYAWSPLAILVVFWQIDSLVVFCVLWAVYALERRKPTQAAVALALGTIIKFSPLFLVPAFLLYLLRQTNSWRQIFRFGLIYTAVCLGLLLGLFPLVGLDYLEGTLYSLGWHNWREGGGLNWHTIFRALDFYLPDPTWNYKAIFLSAGIGSLLLPLGLLLSYGYAHYKRLSLNTTVLVTLLSYFAFTKLVHEYYLVLLLPFALLELQRVPHPKKEFVFKLLWAIPFGVILFNIPVYHFLVSPLAALGLLEPEGVNTLFSLLDLKMSVTVLAILGTLYTLLCLLAIPIFANIKKPVRPLTQAVQFVEPVRVEAQPKIV